MLKNSFLVA